MELMRILQYFCSLGGAGCLIFTYIQMARKKGKKPLQK